MKYDLLQIEVGLSILKSGRTPSYAEKLCGVPSDVLIKCYFRKDKPNKENCDIIPSLTKSTSYWETENEVAKSIIHNEYNIDNMSFSEMKSYLTSIVSSWKDENYIHFIEKK